MQQRFEAVDSDSHASQGQDAHETIFDHEIVQNLRYWLVHPVEYAAAVTRWSYYELLDALIVLKKLEDLVNALRFDFIWG